MIYIPFQLNTAIRQVISILFLDKCIFVILAYRVLVCQSSIYSVAWSYTRLLFGKIFNQACEVFDGSHLYFILFLVLTDFLYFIENLREMKNYFKTNGNKYPLANRAELYQHSWQFNELLMRIRCSLNCWKWR